MLTPEVQLQRPSAYELVVTVRPKANDNNANANRFKFGSPEGLAYSDRFTHNVASAQESQSSYGPQVDRMRILETRRLA